MAKRAGGLRRKTRDILKKHYKNRGKISLTKYFQEFKQGDKVALKAEPGIQKGMYFRRYHGKQGVVVGKQGDCCKILIKDFNMKKTLIVHPIHLKLLK